eukprot:6211844-Prymnesium_polylepis.1
MGGARGAPDGCQIWWHARVRRRKLEPRKPDVNDAARSYAVWERLMPHLGSVDGHYFTFPHV